MEKQLLGGIALCFLGLSILLWKDPWLHQRDDPIMDGVDAPRGLKEHAALFEKKEIVKVVDGVWVAIGFALGNSIMVEGEDGLMIIDVTENVTVAREILANFRNISSKPITYIVYTHQHGDHYKGALGFIEDPENPPEIICHELWETELHKHDAVIHHIRKQAANQFGNDINDDAHLVGGPGPRMRMTLTVATHSVHPTIKIKGEGEERIINGLRTQFIHMPGETRDHLAVFLPDKHVFFPGDNIYKSFPNLYAIRGSPPRDVRIWGDSVLRILDYNPEYVVPSHTYPIVGKDNITHTLTRYSNAIQLVHDQTVRYINHGLHPDEIADRVHLPKHLEEDTYLGQYYGTIQWSVKGVYMQYIGWFNGNPVDLFPVLPKERAQRMVKMIGARQLQRNAEEAFETGDYKWALELVSHLFTLDRNNEAAKLLRRDIFRTLASQQSSANARHFYIQSAMNDANRLPTSFDPSEFIMSIPVVNILQAMKTVLKAEDVEGIRTNVVMNFTEIEEAYLLKLEDSVLRLSLIEERPEHVDIAMTCTSVLFKEFVTKRRNPLAAYIKGDLQIEGGLLNFRTFMSYFESNF